MPPIAALNLILGLVAAALSAQPSSSATDAFSTSRYDLTIEILANSRRLRVTGTWHVPPVDEARDSVAFLLWSRMEGVRARFAGPAGLEPSALADDGQAGDRRYTLRPARPIAPGERVIVEFEYESDTLPAPQFKVSPAVSFAGGGGELWYPQEDFATRDVGWLRFRVREDDVVLAPGTLVSRVNGEFLFEVTSPGKFGFAAGPYRVLEREGDPTLRLYLLHDRSDAAAVLDSVAEAAAVLRRWFGPLRFPALGIAEVEFEGAVLGTSEFGFILADGRQFEREFDFPYWAHELGHQWWGVTVRTRSGTPGRMLMSEGIAEFGALLAIEAVQGEDAAEAYRRGRYPGHYDRTTVEYFRLAAAELELPVAGDPGDRTTLMHRMANTRGFMLLYQLAEAVGRERFVRLLGRFAREYEDEPTSYPEFRDAVRRGAASDVTWVFDEWFERTGAPLYRVEWSAITGGVHGQVQQDAPGFDADLDVALHGAGQVAVHRVAVRGTRTDFEFATSFSVDSVVLDPRFRVLRWTPETRAEALALASYTRADWERRFGDRGQAIMAFRAALQTAPPASRDPYGVRFMLEYGLGRALSDSGAAAEALPHFEAALAAPSVHPQILPFVWIAIARVGRQLEDDELVGRAVREALAADSAAGGRTGASAETRELLRLPDGDR